MPSEPSFLELIFAAVEQWEWKWNELWNLQFFFFFQRGNRSAPITCAVLCKSRCCSPSPQRQKLRVVSSHPLSMRGWWMICTGKESEKKVTRGAWGGIEMRRPARTLGMRRPRKRRAITATHEGVVGTASGNQATTAAPFIIWALMLLAGTTTGKSYTQSRPATEKKTVPSPTGQAVSAWEETG